MKNLSAAGPAVWQCSSTTHTTDRKTATVTMGQAIIAASILLSFFKRKRYSQKLRTLSATEKERIPEERGGGEGQFITSKGTSKQQIRHKPTPPKQIGSHQLWSHRRKPDHYNTHVGLYWINKGR